MPAMKSTSPMILPLSHSFLRRSTELCSPEPSNLQLQLLDLQHLGHWPRLGGRSSASRAARSACSVTTAAAWAAMIRGCLRSRLSPSVSIPLRATEFGSNFGSNGRLPFRPAFRPASKPLLDGAVAMQDWCERVSAARAGRTSARPRPRRFDRRGRRVHDGGKFCLSLPAAAAASICAARPRRWCRSWPAALLVSATLPVTTRRTFGAWSATGSSKRTLAKTTTTFPCTNPMPGTSLANISRSFIGSSSGGFVCGVAMDHPSVGEGACPDRFKPRLTGALANQRLRRHPAR